MSIRVGYYRHYKGMPYRVLGIAHDGDTLEELVAYKPLYGGHGLSVRPLSKFTDMVERDGRLQPRFAFEREAEDVLTPFMEQIS
ncbi:DUF1653 domain-containing protein [Luteibacter aegosomatis]|uniref:DUF1653 domain-containing protein n=1 Tax=Luteibacter TaxID=242605 RepID=UPI00119C3337|nr:DUF1653 domain-containing protein [Luteibacter aegosomatis]UPG84877.1 DUF1653 domain-containing protein [Luteibacter aegosomatis]